MREVLGQRFGGSSVFVDEFEIRAGTDFRQEISKRIESADVVLVLIGPQWAEIMQERAGDEEDYVQIELQTAISKSKRIIPVYIADAPIVAPDYLPQALQSISFLQARKIDPGVNFNSGMRELVNDIRPSSFVARALSMVALAASVAALIIASILYIQTQPKMPERLSFLVVMGENVQYEREIADGFVDRIKEELGGKGVELRFHPRVVPHFEGTYASPKSEQGRRAWSDVVQDIRVTYAPGEIDYFVTLGTFASQAIKDSKLVYDYRSHGHIYLGVTDPKAADLVGVNKVAGVRYGTGGIDYGRKIDELFLPEQKLAFIYQGQEGNIQDKSIAADLQILNDEYSKGSERRSPRFNVKAIDGLIDVGNLQLADPSDPVNSEIYFAWYGLDNILAQENRSSLVNDRLWIVPSTFSPRNLNLAGVIVSVDDRLVGSLGADIVLARETNPGLSLESLPVKTPAFRTWIKRDTVEKKGIRLSPNAYGRRQEEGYSYR